MIYPNDFINKIICGDCLEVSKDIPDGSLDVIVTSPPYWAQRKYTDGHEKEIGQEPYFHDYVSNLGDVFVQLGKKLKPSGSMWINIGDTYYGGMKGTGGKSSKQLTNLGSFFDGKNMGEGFDNKELPRKSLCNIPARLSVYIQDRGYILRNTIIWHKPNAWVTSAKDRFTVDFEYFFWFVKNPVYYFKQQFEPFINNSKWNPIRKDGNSDWDRGTKQETHRARNMRPNEKGRNKRSVWSINTMPLKGLSHFAKFPDKLIETPIKATCPPNGIILDPFVGSGTTALVCKSLGISFIGIDISEEYCEIARQRLEV